VVKRKRYKKLIRHLRENWFLAIIHHWPPEREWEDEEAGVLRVEYNHRMREKFDADTEAILRGGMRMLSPRCSNDLGAK